MQISEKNFRNIPYFTVIELSKEIKNKLENDFNHVRVRGEISGLRFHKTKYYEGITFRLIEEKISISSSYWKSVSDLSFNPEDGLEVICTGKISTFSQNSQYSLKINDIEIAGVGALLKKLEERKKKLEKEGLFDASFKKKLPKYPKVIGVVTSLTGAVIQDIIHRFRERFGVRVLVWGVKVQGNGSSEEIVNALNGFNTINNYDNLPRPEIIIVARGGGDVEDLWTFNEESVVRAVFNSKIPVVSAIGHETDTTLIDYVSDIRAPTPTAAAEICTPVKKEIVNKLTDKHERLEINLLKKITLFEEKLKLVIKGLLHPKEQIFRKSKDLANLSKNINFIILGKINDNYEILTKIIEKLLPPSEKINQFSEKVIGVSAFFDSYIDRILDRRKLELDSYDKLLDANSYQKTLKRGFVLVSDYDNSVLKRGSQIAKNQTVKLQFSDQRRNATIHGKED